MVFCWADKWLNFNLQSYYWQIYTLSKQNSWFVTQSPKKYMSKVYHIRILTTEKLELEVLEPLCYLMHRAWVQTIRWTMDLSLKLSQHERKKVIALRVVGGKLGVNKVLYKSAWNDAISSITQGSYHLFDACHLRCSYPFLNINSQSERNCEHK